MVRRCIVWYAEAQVVLLNVVASYQSAVSDPYRSSFQNALERCLLIARCWGKWVLATCCDLIFLLRVHQLM